MLGGKTPQQDIVLAMTVGQLKKALSAYDDDLRVCVGSDKRSFTAPKPLMRDDLVVETNNRLVFKAGLSS